MDRNDPEFDEFCNPSNPKKIKFDDIVAASRRIVGSVYTHTPLTKANLSARVGMEVYLKLEVMQNNGCFKERGVVNALTMLSEDEKRHGVISATMGNHGIATAYHAIKMNIPCIIVMPTTSPVSKINRVKALGVQVILSGSNIIEAKSHGLYLKREKKMTYITGYDHPNIVEGNGTVGLEIMEQLANVDAVLVPCGGGSLLAGAAVAIKHIKPDTEVYGIETDKTCSMTESIRRGERVFLPIGGNMSDCLAVNMVGVNTFQTIKSGVVDKMIVVREEWVARAILYLAEQERIVVEGGGAVGLAAIMAGLFPHLKGKKVVVVLTGGIIDLTMLARAIERGLSLEGRLIQFKVTVPDRTGSMAELCALISSIGITIRDCVPERHWVKGDVYNVELKILGETTGWDHTKELVELIKKHYRECFFPDMGQSANGVGTRRGPCLAPNPVCMQK